MNATIVIIFIMVKKLVHTSYSALDGKTETNPK